MREVVGEILAGATITEALCELYEPYESKLRGGMFVIIEDNTTKQRLLARVSDIQPEHSFYRKGDAWSGARRAQVKFPDDIGTKYVTCKLEIVARISENSTLKSPNISPFPGSSVIIPSCDEFKKLFYPASDEAIAEFACLREYPDLNIPLLVKNLTMHIGIFGVTGSGKSFTVGALIESLSKIRYKNKTISYPIIIVDLHGDYREYGERGREYGVKGELYGLPGSDRSKYQYIYIDVRYLSFEALAEMIISFYSGAESAPPIQIWAAKLVLEEYCKYRRWKKPDNRLFTDDNVYSELVNLLRELKRKPEKRSEAYLKRLPQIHSQTADAVERAFDKFRDATRANKSDSILQNWNWSDFLDTVTGEGKVVVIDLSPDGAPKVDITVKQLFVGYLAYLLFNVFSEYKSRGEQRFLLLIIEEAQNFCPNTSLYAIGSPYFAKRYISLIATQGRKFGASLALVTQRPVFVDGAILSQCNTFIIHRLAPSDINYVLTATGGLPIDLAKKLPVLEKGEVILSGAMLTTFFPIVAQIMPSHKKAPHKAGTIDFADILRSLSK